MINSGLFKKIEESYSRYYKEREGVVTSSRKVLLNSKEAIFALQRNDLDKAEKLVFEAKEIISEMSKKFVRDNRLRYEGSFNEGLEEFVEANLFLQFEKEKKIDLVKDLDISSEEYIAGICDFTGELLRKVIKLVTEGKKKEIEVYSECVENIVAELIKLDLRGYLRYKFDQAKRNLKEFEKILYEIRLIEEKND